MAEQKLTDKQAAFVREYMKDSNATQAAIRAGYSEKSAGDIGKQLLLKTPIADAIRKKQQKAEEKAEFTIQDLLRMRIEDYNFNREALQIFDKDGGPIGTKMRDAAAANATADQINKMLGGYDKDNRQRSDMRLEVCWGGDDES